MMTNPQKGDLQIYWMPQIPCRAMHYEVESPAEAKRMLDLLALYDLFLLRENHRVDFSNAGGLRVFDGDDWQEWEDENGAGIDEACE